jgi:hypothetical protein
MYALKDLYDDINLFDRKIAHCRTYESFISDQARASAVQKLVQKRETLVRNALAMAGRGVECDPKYLPRSLKEPVADSKAAL